MVDNLVRYIARYASVTVQGWSLFEVGDVLALRGFDMAAARELHDGTLVVPHVNPERRSATVYREVVDGDEEPLEQELISVEVATAIFAGEKVRAGIDEGPGLHCRACGAIHPEGMVCLVPVLFEQLCCQEKTYAHKGPHEARSEDGLVTHRWIEEVVVTDLPFDSYGCSEMQEDGVA